ncbi:uncharacterized protein LOC126264846 [Aethina tumida]|uniref:uncharacterized protein LOC126264846 n=1 Tax=Aethina tumida TaxID=116153 RepID=UPI00214912E7|nr:uncharacterized protein LOC126264846 [Aethina tumida]
MDYSKLKYTLKNPYLSKFLSPTAKNPFSLSMYTSQAPEVIPTLIISIVDMCWLVYSCIYGLRRTDLDLTRKYKRHNDLYELLINPVNRKLYTENQTFPPNQTLYDIYMNMQEKEEDREKRKQEECPKEVKCDPINDPPKEK